MEIKEGMYVRLKANNVTYIRQIIEVCKDIRYATYKVDKPFCNQTGLSPKKIIKASFNIINVLEIGDFVDGNEVVNITLPDACGDEELDDGLIHFENYKEYPQNIKNIITKESFESGQYEVGE